MGPPSQARPQRCTRWTPLNVCARLTATQRQQGRALFVRMESLTTVEMGVDEAPTLNSVRVGVRVAWGEKQLGRTVRAAGGTWDPAARVWMMTLGQAKSLGPTDRTVWGPAP